MSRDIVSRELRDKALDLRGEEATEYFNALMEDVEEVVLSVYKSRAAVDKYNKEGRTMGYKDRAKPKGWLELDVFEGDRAGLKGHTVKKIKRMYSRRERRTNKLWVKLFGDRNGED